LRPTIIARIGEMGCVELRTDVGLLPDVGFFMRRSGKPDLRRRRLQRGVCMPALEGRTMSQIAAADPVWDAEIGPAEKAKSDSADRL
jgi:hypothetical protein